MNSAIKEKCSTRPKDAVIKCGWVKKRIKYNMVRPYSDRFLCLTTASILYFHTDSHINDEGTADCKIPLHAVSHVSITQDGDANVDSLNIEIVINNGRFENKLEFQCPGTHEGTFWIQEITRARELLLATHAVGSPLPPVTWKRHLLNKTITGTVGGMLKRLTSSKHISDIDLLTETQILSLVKLGNLLACDRDASTEIVEAVFDALNDKDGTRVSHVEISRKLGQAIAMWLGADPLELDELSMPGPPVEERHAAGALLEVWLKVALNRELKSTADASDNPDIATHGEGSSPPLSPLSSSAAVVKMPFRGDNCESIFLANFVKGVALKSGTLSVLLQQIILGMAVNPEAFDAKPVMSCYLSEAPQLKEENGLSASAAGPPCKDEVLSHVDLKETNNSDNASAIGDSSEVCERNVGVEGSKLAARSSASELSMGGKLCVVSASINDVCSSLFETVAISYDALPTSMSLLINIIYEIAFGAAMPPSGSLVSRRGASATIFPEAENDNAERLFCTASCGIIFLRLLCPALISPLEWGALRRRHKASSVDITAGRPQLSRQDSDGPRSNSMISSMMDFLSISPTETQCPTSTSAPADPAKEAEEFGWVEPTDEDLKSSGRSLVDVGAASAALVIIAHVLIESPDILKVLNIKLKQILMSDLTSFLSPENIPPPPSPVAEHMRSPKRKSEPTQLLSSIKHFVHTRTWSQSPMVDTSTLHEDPFDDTSATEPLGALLREVTASIPLSKADDILKLHYIAHASLVDPSTEKTLRSPAVRKALVNVAKSVQRVANASCVPESQLEDYIRETSISGKSGEHPEPGNHYTEERINHNFMLSSAVLLKRMYRNIASTKNADNEEEVDKEIDKDISVGPGDPDKSALLL